MDVRRKRNARNASVKFFKGLGLFSLPLVVTCLLSNQVSKENNTTFEAETLDIEFSDFSPAYAAFEDEFLFKNKIKSMPLIAGLSDSYFKDQMDTEIKIEETKKHQLAIHSAEPTKNKISYAIEEDFKGLAFVDQTESNVIKHDKEPEVQKMATPEFELNFGPMVAAVYNPETTKETPIIQAQSGRPPANKPTQDTDVKTQSKEYMATGPIELKDGLAFLGTMEVSWVIDDHEVEVGAINTPDGTYEIKVNDFIGDIVVSLYDESDELIGEGIANLDEVRSASQLKDLKIDVKPVDWDTAGEVVHIYSLNSNDRPIEGADILLYAYNDSATTDKKGQIKFAGWQKSNSKTLAIASKKGFRDSIFLIDSKKPAKVLLFENKYMNAFYDWISHLGINDVEDQGTIYGAIVKGNDSLEGYKVSIPGVEPLYFNDLYFATNNQRITNKNGMFAFVGLEDGDYEIFVEKDGIVIDRRIIAVESGKVSPLLIDVRRKKKRLEFFDPMNPLVKPKKVEVSFFDGEDILDANAQAELEKEVVGGNDPSLIDYASDEENISNTFISRQKGLERVAIINKEKVLPIIEKYNFLPEQGLAVGYISAEKPYRVAFEEDVADNIIYFDSNGSVIDPESQVAQGFIIHGFHRGLHTLSVEDVEDNIIVMTDLLFSDHQSISILHGTVEGL